jgi:hypothetical protein
MKRELNQKLSGNEVDYTKSLISLVENMLCSKLQCQKGFNLIPSSLKSVPELQTLPLSVVHLASSVHPLGRAYRDCVHYY